MSVCTLLLHYSPDQTILSLGIYYSLLYIFDTIDILILVELLSIYRVVCRNNTYDEVILSLSAAPDSKSFALAGTVCVSSSMGVLGVYD